MRNGDVAVLVHRLHIRQQTRLPPSVNAFGLPSPFARQHGSAIDTARTVSKHHPLVRIDHLDGALLGDELPVHRGFPQLNWLPRFEVLAHHGHHASDLAFCDVTKRVPFIGTELNFLGLGRCIITAKQVSPAAEHIVRGKHTQLRLLERLALFAVFVQLVQHATRGILPRGCTFTQTVQQFALFGLPRLTRSRIDSIKVVEVVSYYRLADLERGIWL